MIFSSDDILKLSNNQILEIITKSKYIGYRLGDIILGYPSRIDNTLHGERYMNNCLIPQKKNFPNSIAIKYVNLYKGNKSLGLRIGDSENCDECLSILKNLCDEFNIEKPSDDSLVATIRLGDMIENNQEKRDGKKLVELGGHILDTKWWN